MDNKNKTETSEFKTFDLGEEATSWFKSTEGLLFLSDCWTSSLYHLKLRGAFEEEPSDYKELKNGSLLSGLRLEHQEILEIDSEGNLDSYDQLYRWVFTIGFHFKTKAKEAFERLSKNAKSIQLDKLFNLVGSHATIQASRLVVHIPWSDNEVRSEWIWDAQGSAAYEIFEVASTDSEFKKTSGLTFVELFSKLRTTTTDESPNGEASENTSATKGTIRNRWERKLTQYLFNENFIVLQQPEVLLPDCPTGARREPDLLVIHKGRAIAIEIDDKSHLVAIEDQPKEGLRKGQVNIPKWQRDRDLDRYMLCNGVPVLRVWYEDVDKHPETVMSQILQIYDSLGGDRHSYR